MSRYENFEAEIFAELRRQGIDKPDEFLRYPVIDGQYVGPNYATRESLKYGFLKSPDHRLNHLVSCWVYYCTALWCSTDARRKLKSFNTYLRSDLCRVSMGGFAGWVGVKDLMRAA